MKTKLLRLFIVMAISITALFALGITASAATESFNINEGPVTITADGDYIISGTGETTTNTITVESGVSANITLSGVNIDVSSQSDTAAFKIADNSKGNVTITLADGTTNTLKSGTSCAGLQKNGAFISKTEGKLTIQGTGSLTATGGAYGAGIGGGDGGAGSNITISGGTVTATGGNYGAGIGGGYYGKGSNITISGGTVTATGSESGAGIGGGRYGKGTDITISGGTVTATGGKNGAGIGGGYDGAGSDIAISGGTVTATGGLRGAGIGGGDPRAGSNITISGGTVTATGGEYGAGIGGGYGSDGSNIQISNSIVTVTGGEYGAGIGGGDNGNGAYDLSGTQNAIIIDNTAKTVMLYGAVTLTEDLEVPVNFIMTIPEGATLTVSAGVTLTNNGIINNNGTITNNGTIINSNIFTNDGEINGTEIEGNEITVFELIVTGGNRGTDYTVKNCILTVLTDTPITVKNADLNKATISRIVIENDVSADITLAGVNIDVFSLEKTAALMIADNSKGNVTITLADGTTNTLKSGLDCAGLQKNGNADDIGTLTIQGEGTLSATGGENGAGIGGGLNGAGSDITISGGTVIATGGDSSAGIGGGDGGAGSNITISGGTVTATGNYDAAGIGGGLNGAGSDITISGGTVTATGGGWGAGIGGGRGHAGSDITISGGTITATGGNYGAGIGGGMDRTGSNITISGGSVKAVAGADANAIGGGYGKDAVTPTDGNGNNVYLFEIENANNADIVINGKDYPDKHFDETKIYAYLPAKTAQTPNEVAVGTEMTEYCYDTANSKWLKVVDAPEADTAFTYNGEVQTYTLAESEYYTISDNTTQTNAGNYTVTVALKDKDNTVWNDGTADDKEYTFIIAKAELTVTAESYTIKVGEALPTYAYDVAGLVNNEQLPIDATISCTADGKTAGTYDIVVSGAAESDNYTITYVNGKLTITPKAVQTITADDVVLTYGDTNGKITAVTDGDGDITYTVATGADVISVDENGNITVLKAGTATVTVKAAETDTYAAATKTVTVTVNKKKIAVPTADTTEYTYNGTAQTYSVTSAADYTVEGGTQTNAGEYPITITLNNENYEWDGTLGTYIFIIKRVPVTVTAKSYTIEVGEALPTYAYDVAGLVNNEQLPIDVTISCTADGKTAGTYDIVVSGAAESDNYTITYVNGKLTVEEDATGSGNTGDGTGGNTGDVPVIPPVTTPSTTPSYTGRPSWVTTPAETTTTTTSTTTTTTPADDDIDDDTGDEDIEIEEDTDTTKPADDDEPQIKGEDDKTGWDVISDEIADADDGDTVIVDMNGVTEVPENILEQIQGQDIDLVLEMDNGFVWNINGEDVTDPQTVDMGVSNGSDIPVKVINEVTGECYYITITLEHDGEFGFTAVLTVDMGDENEGLYANLYRYTDNDTEFIRADKINSKGKADLTFTHASEYIIVIDEENHGKRVEESTDNDVDGIVSEEEDANPETGVAICFGCVIVSAMTVMLTRKRKNK